MDELKRVMFRGTEVIEGWPEKIEEAQKLRTWVVNGEHIPRVRYGDEQDDWGANERPCHDCAVIKGELHVPGCDGEECPKCGGQIITCTCPFDDCPKEFD